MQSNIKLYLKFRLQVATIGLDIGFTFLFLCRSIHFLFQGIFLLLYDDVSALFTYLFIFCKRAQRLFRFDSEFYLYQPDSGNVALSTKVYFIFPSLLMVSTIKHFVR